MIFKRTSPISGKTIIRELPVTQQQFDELQAGKLIQDVMPQLNIDDREWLINGTTKEDWDWLNQAKGEEE